MPIDPLTGLEKLPDPNAGIINANATPATPTTTGVGTTPISSGSVSSQLDQILGTSTPSTPIGTAQGQAKTWDVTKDQTVEGRVAGIIDNKALSPIMERAQAGANEAANARGLINSSMGVQAGQAAVLDAATGIATTDAATYADAAKTNAAFGNQYGLAAQQQGFNIESMDKAAGIALKMYDTQLQGDMEKMAKAQGYSLETMNAQQVLDLGKAAVLQGYETANKLADRDTQLAVNKLLTDNKLLVDTNVTAQKALSDYSTALIAIANNKDLSSVINPATGKSPRQIAIDNAAISLNNSLTILSSISGIDFADLLDFGDAGGDTGTGGQPVAGTTSATDTAAAAAVASAPNSVDYATAGTNYLANNPDVANSGFAGQAARHWNLHGRAEGRVWTGPVDENGDAYDPNKKTIRG